MTSVFASKASTPPPPPHGIEDFSSGISGVQCVFPLSLSESQAGQYTSRSDFERTEDTEQVNRAAPLIMTTSRIRLFSLLWFGGFALWPLDSSALEGQVSREQDIVNLQLGQRVKVDDGSCPAGQIKEISGAKMTATGIVRAQKCIPRLKK
jgi:hypothetical protein